MGAAEPACVAARLHSRRLPVDGQDAVREVTILDRMGDFTDRPAWQPGQATVRHICRRQRATVPPLVLRFGRISRRRRHTRTSPSEAFGLDLPRGAASG